MRRRTRALWSWIVVIACLLGGVAAPAAAQPVDRERLRDKAQLHRNPGRGEAYLSRVVPDARAEPATIEMRPIARWPLPIDPEENVRSAVLPIDADGDGRLELLQLQGYRVMRLFERSGRQLWGLRDPRGRIHRSHVHRDTLASLDVNGDGYDELVHCWLDADGDKTLVVRSPRTGIVHRSASLAADGARSECQIAAFRVPGRATPLILVARQASFADAPCDRRYVDEWSVTEAYDTELRLVWRRGTCRAGHYAWPLDEDEDGLAEAILVGKYLLEPDGALRCVLPGWGLDHVDSAVVADLDPQRPGHEIAAVGRTGTRTYRARDCAPIATVGPGTIVNPQVVHAARLEPGADRPAIVVRSRPSEPVPYVYRIDVEGRILDRYVDTNPRHQQPMTTADLDGATAAEDLVTAFGQVVDGRGRLRLGTDWYWDLQPLSAAERALSPYMQWSSAPLVVDLDGDGRDELVTWGRRLMVIGRGG